VIYGEKKCKLQKVLALPLSPLGGNGATWKSAKVEENELKPRIRVNLLYRGFNPKLAMKFAQAIQRLYH